MLLISSVVLVLIGVAPASADTVAPLLPVNSELFGVGYYSPFKVGKINTVDSTVSLLPEDVGDAEAAEGAGYDSVTGKTWIMQDCELFSMNPDGSTQSVFSVITENDLALTGCFGFTPRGDGTAYLTARLDVPVDDPDPALYTTLFTVSLFSGEVIGSPVSIDLSNPNYPGGIIANPYNLEPTDLAYNPVTGDLWVTSYEGYVYLLNPVDGSISNIFDGFISLGEWSWGMAVDSNNVLWLSVGNAVTWKQLVALSPDSDWERHDFPDTTVPGSTEVFNTDAMWIRVTTPPAGSESNNVTPLANTGFGNGDWIGISVASLLLGVAFILVRSRMARQR